MFVHGCSGSGRGDKWQWLVQEVDAAISWVGELSRTGAELRALVHGWRWLPAARCSHGRRERWGSFSAVVGLTVKRHSGGDEVINLEWPKWQRWDGGSR
jgi:hypothetical protein